MKKVTIVFLFMFFSAALMAQRIYFIYLQTETYEPFFVRLNEKVYNSSASGYLILSKLRDTTYNFRIGFPGKNIDMNFSSGINNKDHGFLIKNFGDKGWGLFDMQTLKVQMSSSNTKTVAGTNKSSDLQVNAFTDLLSKASDDPSLKQNPILVKTEEKKPEIIQPVQNEIKTEIVQQPVVKPEEKKTETVQHPVNKPEEKQTETVQHPANKPEEKKIDTVNTNDQQPDHPVSKPDEKKAETINTNDPKAKQPEKKPIQKEEIYKRSQVTKVSGTNTSEGFELVFIDQNSNGIDSVKIIIPDNKTAVIAKEEPGPEVKKEDKKFLDIDNTDTASNKPQAEIKKEDSKISEPVRTEKTVVQDTKNNCKAVATQNDFLKLLRKMAAESNDDRMIGEAKKYFRMKCFTTEQIKNLSSMFLSNAGKYHFFDAAYEYIADKENFSSLQTELKDEYYINRFKAMLQN